MGGRIDRIHCYGAPAMRAVTEHRDLLHDRETVFLDRDSFADAIGLVEALFCHAPPAGLWAQAGRLRLIQTVGAGLDQLLPAPDLTSDVAVANARGLTSAAMAEFALAQLLFLVKRFPESLDNQRARQWRATTPGLVVGRRVTVLGLGPVGLTVARLLAGLGAQVTGVARRAREVPGFGAAFGVRELRSVLMTTDDLVVALPLTPATRSLIGYAELALMPPGGTVVNVARGELIDEHALVESLATGHLSGAALDTVRNEPLSPEDPLWTCPRLLITAHVSWTSPGYERDLVRLLVENIDRSERGLRPRNEVDRQLGYPAGP